MIGFSRSARSPIGCDITQDGIGLAQITNLHGTPRLRLAWEPASLAPHGETREGRDQTVDRIKAALRSEEFEGSDAVMCVPRGAVNYRRMPLHGQAEDDVKHRLSEEVALDWGVDRTAIRADVIEIPQSYSSPKGSRDVIAVIAEVAQLESHANMVRQAGLEPIAADIAAGALARCIDPGSDDQKPTLIVEVGRQSRTSIIVRHRIPCFVCTRGGRTCDGRGPTSAASTMPMRAGPHVRDAGMPLRATGLDGSESAESAMDVIQETASLLQYLLDSNLDHLMPARAAVLGVAAGVPPAPVLPSEHSPLSFVPLAEVLHPRVRSEVARLVGVERAESLLTPIGLALYGCESALEVPIT